MPRCSSGPASITPAEYDAMMGDAAHEEMVPGVWNTAIDLNLSAPFDGDPGPTSPHPILGDLRVRQAIAHAIDYESLVRDVLRNTVSESNSPFAYGWFECGAARVCIRSMSLPPTPCWMKPAG